MTEMYPIFLKLEARPVLVVGAGKVAWRKAEALLAAGAELTVVAPQVCPELNQLADSFTLHRREWQPSDCDGALLVIAATGDSKINARIRECARKAGALVNAVDDPPNCDFYLPAVARVGELRVAVSTQGKAPLIAGQLRRFLEQNLPGELAELVELISAEREKVLASDMSEEERIKYLKAFLAAELEKRDLQL
ncbi:MAG: bifunctional precorrin-2 dehydrogenase/sirohydrochlorin ferrochelatase [Planctomycetes bacterium]|nr:bifunctional precorrin-2 dehydrogenase/sirohydrochlorin ferrochelatase [Planctomycetota bacterium]